MVECDALKCGVGAILMQKERPIVLSALYSKEKNIFLSMYEKELLALRSLFNISNLTYWAGSFEYKQIIRVLIFCWSNRLLLRCNKNGSLNSWGMTLLLNTNRVNITKWQMGFQGKGWKQPFVSSHHSNQLGRSQYWNFMRLILKLQI